MGSPFHCRFRLKRSKRLLLTLLVKITGARAPEKAGATLHTITAPAKATASLEHPDVIAPVTRAVDYSKDLTLDLVPFTVMVLEIKPV